MGELFLVHPLLFLVPVIKHFPLKIFFDDGRFLLQFFCLKLECTLFKQKQSAV